VIIGNQNYGESGLLDDNDKKLGGTVHACTSQLQVTRINKQQLMCMHYKISVAEEVFE